MRFLLQNLQQIINLILLKTQIIQKHHYRKKKKENKIVKLLQRKNEPCLIRDRTGVSDRAAASIAISVLHDNAECSGTNPLLVLDRSKVRKSRQKHCTLLQQRSKRADDDKDIIALYFDGGKDQTMTKKISGNSTEIVQEEHTSLIEEPKSKYFGHFALKKVSATVIASGVFDFLSANHKEKNTIIAIGYDGNAVNTGAKEGALRMIELNLNKPVYWFICQLHANELPLRHLFQTLDGKTTNPKGYSGEIGKMLNGCGKLDVVNFKYRLTIRRVYFQNPVYPF